eukprot:scaffold2380_cov102-Isochrysis_galbana.AAC.16
MNSLLRSKQRWPFQKRLLRERALGPKHRCCSSRSASLAILVASPGAGYLLMKRAPQPPMDVPATRSKREASGLPV